MVCYYWKSGLFSRTRFVLEILLFLRLSSCSMIIQTTRLCQLKLIGADNERVKDFEFRRCDQTQQ